MLFGQRILIVIEALGSSIQCNSYLCSFMTFMTGVVKVVKQCSESVMSLGGVAGTGVFFIFFEGAKNK